MSANWDLVRSIYADWERSEWGRGGWEQRKIVRITGYPDIDEARAAAERLAKERG